MFTTNRRFPRPTSVVSACLIAGLALTLGACGTPPDSDRSDVVLSGRKSTPPIAKPLSAVQVRQVKQVKIVGLTKSALPETALSATRVLVSDFNLPSQTAEALADGNPATFWHVKNPIKDPRHWIILDFGKPVRVKAVAVLSRSRFNEQLWRGANAIFAGGRTASPTKGWTELATLVMDEGIRKSQKQDWVIFAAPADKPYRYYRLSIKDPSFLSLAELKVIPAA